MKWRAFEHNLKNTEFYVHILPCRGGLWRSGQVKYFLFLKVDAKTKQNLFWKLKLVKIEARENVLKIAVFLVIFQHLKNFNECCRAHNELKIGGRPYFGMNFHKKNRRKNWRTPRTAFLKSRQELLIYIYRFLESLILSLVFVLRN